MQCPKCHSFNPPGSLYCSGCGLSQAQQRKMLEHANQSSVNQAAVKTSTYKKPPQSSLLSSSRPRNSKPIIHPGASSATPKTALSNPLQVFLESGNSLENKFKLNKEIGRGGMGHVYAARDMSLGRDVAVKVLPPHYNEDESVVARFQREARAMASLDHPNIVTVYSIGQDASLHYFVMKLLAGETLAHKLKRQEIGQIEPYSIKTIIELLIQACNGLEHAHDKGLLHRDIKPGNLMINDDYKLTIMDFGIVKRLDNSTVDTVGLKTAHGKIFGTPEYMPPEQAMGKGDYAAGSDIYALAVVAYELLCGRLPFLGDAPLEIILQHIRSPAPNFTGRARGKYPTFERVIQKAMAKTLYDRYSDANEFRNALQGALMNEHSVQMIDMSQSNHNPSPAKQPAKQPAQQPFELLSHDTVNEQSIHHTPDPSPHPVSPSAQQAPYSSSASANASSPQVLGRQMLVKKVVVSDSSTNQSQQSSPLSTETALFAAASDVIIKENAPLVTPPKPATHSTPLPASPTPSSSKPSPSAPLSSSPPLPPPALASQNPFHKDSSHASSAKSSKYEASQAEASSSQSHQTPPKSDPKPSSSSTENSKAVNSFQLRMNTGQSTHASNSPKETAPVKVTPASKRPGHYKGLPIRRKK